MGFIQESDQKMNQTLATDIANEFKPFLKDSINYEGIKHTMHYLMVMNHSVEIYLLDDTGKILAFFAEPGKQLQQNQISLDPIEEFLNGSRQMPILGDDPRHVGKNKTFSATRVQIGNITRGYIYVILMGEQYDSAAAMIRESYIIRTTSIGILAAFVTTGVIGLILFALLTKRFHRVTSTVKEFEQGKYDVRIDSKSGDEVGQLSQAFDHMAETITANMEELKKTDDLRRELVANVSHDLRSPLASIQGYLETIMMKDDQLSGEQSRKYLQTIFDNTKMLGNLVDDLFELSKLDARQIKPSVESFSMAELTQDVVIKFKPLAEKLGITLDVNFSKSLPQVQADIGLMERVLSNLIDNAIRLTPPKGSVTIHLKKHGSQVLVDITDTGPGIPAEELPLIFERFYRIDKSRTKSYGGAGLGLAIAKKIIELHDCEIQVKSKVNQGTTFSFGLRSSLVGH
jgi:signal transduction histidine kinase